MNKILDMKYSKRMVQPEDMADAIRRYWIAKDYAIDVPTTDEIRAHRGYILQKLTERQREALIRRADNHETLRTAADEMGVSFERVRQLYTQAIRKGQKIAEYIICNVKIEARDEPVEVLGISYLKCGLLHENGIDTVEQLTTKNISQLTKIRTIGNTMAQYLLDISRNYIAENAVQERAETVENSAKLN